MLLNLLKPYILCVVLNFSEQPCSVITPLENTEVTEKGTTVLKIVLSKSRPVKWLTGSESILGDDERFKASSSDSGLEHTLTISNISTEDSGIFTAEVNDNDYGNITSSATLTVKGRSFITKSIVNLSSFMKTKTLR